MMNNPFFQYLNQVEEHPERYSKKIVLMVKQQREMLQIYDFIEEKGRKCCDWIEKNCYLTEGEQAGKPVKLMLWQKWIIYSIFCFYGNIDVEEFNEEGEFIGIEKKYTRIVNDCLIMLASGNSKTTFLGFIILYIMYHRKVLPSPKIYIGSNAYKQSKLCFDVVRKIIKKNPNLELYANIRNSIGEIEIEDTNAKLNAMSSTGDNYEGIIPALLVIDEIHAMQTSTYADNLRKSTKRSDKLIIEITTQGTCRGGYLDQRLDLATKLLENKSGEKDYRKFFAIYEQDSEEEVFNALNGDVSVLMKSNPSLSIAVSVEELKDKIKAMMNDPKQKSITLTKNFNIPQNPISSYFSEVECRTKKFNEDIFYNAPVFLGLDMAYTRSPENDLTALTMMMVNPFTNEEYYKDIYFLPKHWEQESKINGKVEITKKDMIIEKSKVDSNILYNKQQNQYGYKLYADKGDVVIVDDKLVNELVEEFGEQARCDTTGITEEFVIFYIAHLEKKYGWYLCKFGLDPNKASKIRSFAEANVYSTDGKNPVIPFRMEDKRNSNPIIISTKDIRKQKKVYDNNKLTELHFASAIAKEDNYGNIIFTNPQRSRKDGVISHLAVRSAYNVYTTNKDTGMSNLENLKSWWKANEERLNGILSKESI